MCAHVHRANVWRVRLNGTRIHNPTKVCRKNAAAKRPKIELTTQNYMYYTPELDEKQDVFCIFLKKECIDDARFANGKIW